MRIAAEEKAAEEAAARLAAEEAARLAAEQAAAEEAARIAAEQQAAEEEAARLAAEEAAAAEAARLAAEQAAADAARERMAEIDTAQDNLASAETALMALADDATDEMKRDAQRMVEATANTLRDVLRANGGSDADIEAAIGKAVTAKNAADALQATITAAASAAAQARMANIATAQTTLSDAETALMALADDATDEAQRDAQRAVEMAAAALVQVLMDNEGTADQIAAATMKQESAKMMADGLQATITAAAEAAAAAQMLADQRSAIASAITAATSAVSAVNNDSTDAEVSAAEMAIAAITAAINAATDVPDSEKAANNVTVVTLTGQLATAKATRMAAMDAAAMAAARAEQMRKIAEAQGAVDAAQDALDEAFGDEDGTEEDIIAALRAIEAAADNLLVVLRANGGSAEDIDKAAGDKRLAKEDADYRQRMVDAAAQAAEERKTAQTTALMEAADGVDTSDLMTAEDIAAANTAIGALKAALAAAVDVSDADKAIYQATVDAAETAVMTAQSALDRAAQMAALSTAVTTLQTIDLSDLTTEEKIDAADAAIAGLRTALEGDELSDADKATAMVVLATASRAVTAAQARVDIAGQMMMLSDAVKALEAIDLDDLMTQEDIDKANRAIDTLNLALEGAADLSDAQTLDATLDLRSAMRKVASAQDDLDTNIDNQRMALTDAAEDLGDIDLDDLDTKAKADAAQAAVDALKMALEDATHLSDDDKAMYQTQLDTATETVKTAQTGMDLTGRMAAQRTAITNAMMNARTAVAGVDNDSTASEVASADNAIAALKTAIDDAEDLPEGDTDVATAMGTLTTLEGLLTVAKTARTDYLANKGDEDMKAMAATGKALRAALAGPDPETQNALNNLEVTPPVFAANGDLTIDAAAGAGSLEGTAVHAPVDLKAGASAGALGSWNGMDYSHTNTGTKVVNEARVYTNQGGATMEPFGDEYNIIDTENDPNLGLVLLVTAGTPAADISLTDVMASTFEHSGLRNHVIPEGRTWFAVRGTLQGAPGEYRCTTGPCSSTNDGSGSPSALAGTWHFKPDTGAMVSQPDANYLYYGWWVRKDKDGMPTAASAFAGVAGDIDPISAATGTDTLAITGSATYTGGAAGKFAISNPLDGTGDGGHFTADATLNAKFGGDGAGISGMLDNFMANDKSVPWSIALNNTATSGLDANNNVASISNISETGAISTSENRDGTAVDESRSTVWSIDGNSAAASGTWRGQMYDELPGLSTVTPPGDDSNIPTTVTGTFYSEFSTIGRIVGAFGANKQ